MAVRRMQDVQDSLFLHRNVINAKSFYIYNGNIFWILMYKKIIILNDLKPLKYYYLLNSFKIYV